jgi:hypothetical protein
MPSAPPSSTSVSFLIRLPPLLLLPSLLWLLLVPVLAVVVVASILVVVNTRRDTTRDCVLAVHENDSACSAMPTPTPSARLVRTATTATAAMMTESVHGRMTSHVKVFHSTGCCCCCWWWWWRWWWWWWWW